MTESERATTVGAPAGVREAAGARADRAEMAARGAAERAGLPDAGMSDAGPISPLPHDPLPPLPLARLYLTGDLRAAAGISRTHMDYYLREGLIQPTAKTAGGYLLFDERELLLLRWVIEARAAGGSLRQIRERLGR